MFKDLRGKKLLILGGIALASDIVLTAKKLGVYTIVIDWFDDYKLSPAKKIADENYQISVADVDKVVELIRDKNIDGVITGFVDSILGYYNEICDKAGLHCYCSKEQIELMTDKNKFKELCKKFYVPVVKDYKIQSPPSTEDLTQLEYPVIIKPVDNSGGKGAIVVYNKGSFLTGYKYALKYSHIGNVIIEQYMEDSDHFSATYTIDRGRYVLSALYDRIMSYEQEGFAPVCIGSFHPSKHIDLFIKDIDPYFQNLLKHLRITNGTVTVQGLVFNKSMFLYDPIFRLAGDQIYRFTDIQNGTNLLMRLIRFALLGEMVGPNDSIEKDDPFFPRPCITLCLYIKPGRIDRIDGIEKVKRIREVFNIVQQIFVGDTINSVGANRQPCFRIKLIANDVFKLLLAVQKVYDAISIISDQGDIMLMDQYSIDRYLNNNHLTEAICITRV